VKVKKLKEFEIMSKIFIFDIDNEELIIQKPFKENKQEEEKISVKKKRKAKKKKRNKDKATVAHIDITSEFLIFADQILKEGGNIFEALHMLQFKVQRMIK